MKRLLLTVVGFILLTSSAQAHECKLDHAIKIPSWDGKVVNELKFKNAEFDQDPRFIEPRNGKALFLKVFHPNVNGKDSSYLGASVYTLESNGSYDGLQIEGFSSHEAGWTPGFTGSNLENGNRFEYSTSRHSKIYGIDETGAKVKGVDEIYEFKMVVDQGQLLSLEFTFPLDTNIIFADGHSSYWQTGEHQTLCLKSAELVQ